MRIPPHDRPQNGFFSAKNVAAILISVATLYLCIILIQVCKKKRGGRHGELEEEFISQGSLSYEYTYDEEYTNSYYQRSDEENSLVDHKHFRYDQSLGNTSSRAPSSSGGDSDTEVRYKDLS